MKNIYIYGMAAALAAGSLVSCSPEDGYSEYQRTQAAFLEELGDNVSPMQWWRTSVELHVTVRTMTPVKIYAVSAEDRTTLFDYKEVKESSKITLTVPQGMGESVLLMYVYDRQKEVVKVPLTGKSEENVTISTMGSAYEVPEMARTRNYAPLIRRVEGEEDDRPYDPGVSQSLHGHSRLPGKAEHYEFNLDQKLEIVQLLSIMSQEGVDAKKGHGLNCDYELESRGPFRITWLFGYEMYQDPHILGYYYHSEGTYDDIKFVDVSETHKYDIIDGLAKVQYQIRDTSYAAHPEYGILPNVWYDANYDMRDVFGAQSASNSRRVGDQAYNSVWVFQTFGTGVGRLRGLSFPIDVPEGMRVGFYLKMEEDANPAQWDQLYALGIKGIGERSQWKATNFSAEAFNQNRTHRSCIIPYEHTTWMGMEDMFGGGDYDCNDVMFGITTDLDIYKPEIIDPDINIIVNIEGQMPWTIAYEDVGREADFDFNDAVIKILPNYEDETCCVTVEAAGSNARMYLHYDGPHGDVNLGEIHSLLGEHHLRKVNTETSVAQIPFCEIDCVPWPSDYTVANDARRFYIEVQRGDCKDCTDQISLAYNPGETPQAILVAGEWKWPMEGVHIFSAYNSFPNWAKDASQTSYWNWYSNSKTGTVTNY